jgi:hypothetical protein
MLHGVHSFSVFTDGDSCIVLEVIYNFNFQSGGNELECMEYVFLRIQKT